MINSSIDSDDGIYSKVDSLVDINNILVTSNNVTLKKVNGKRYGFDKIYMGKELIEAKVYQIIDQFNERKMDLQSFIQYS